MQRVRRASSTNEKARINAVGIQYLSRQLQDKVFPRLVSTAEDPKLLAISRNHLQDNDLWGKPTRIESPITIDNFPDLVGQSGTLDEHFHKLGARLSEPYLSMAKTFLSTATKLPPRPESWIFKSGWTRYVPNEPPQSVPYPLEDELVFDVEVMYKVSPYAVINTAVTKKAWYGWVSPLLTEYAKDPSYNDYEHLIPFNCLKHPKLMVGYSVGYDRARVFDEYNIEQSKAFYLDGMALHVATTGICSRQRPQWVKYKKEVDEENKRLESTLDADTEPTGRTYSPIASDGLAVFDLAQKLRDNPWLNKGAPNSLKIVARHHCGIVMDKSDRDYFSSTNPQDIIDNFQRLMDYCADDVDATFKVTAKLFPEFRKHIPHPVSFAALRHLGTLILPTTKKWDGYIETAYTIYHENKKVVTDILNKIVDLCLKIKPDEDGVSDDAWLSQLNWEIKQPRVKKNGDPYKRQAFLTGYPQWYRDLYRSGEVQLSLSLRTRVTPLLLRLKWEGFPLFWTTEYGWCFKAPYNELVIDDLNKRNYTRVLPREREADNDANDDILELLDQGFTLFKIPHPNGPNFRCTNVLGKNYLSYFENGVLSSEYEFAKEILNLNAQSSYWMGNRQRIKDQFIVFNEPTDRSKNMFFQSRQDALKHPDMGIILPKICSMGTVTRRAVENTWLTASNSKKNRIGSELKAMIEVPRGYAFVGADVDSEELWIASLMGDSAFKFHGATALGWMTLEGTKNEGTDLHSKTANILGILRNDAKVFNYGRIYGAGVKFATRLLMQFNSKLSETEAAEVASTLYIKTKGTVKHSRILGGKVYHGGSESVMFNRLEKIATSEAPKTPVLGASITSALTKKNLNSQQFLPSRVNWTIQSSGVDYLHLLIISMEYLSEKFCIPMRLSITVHDELRYLCKEEHKYQTALLLQISNLWTRAMFCQQLGIDDVPQSCAFFSEVDIDHVLRKNVRDECITPSHPEPIKAGEALSMMEILKKCKNGRILRDAKELEVEFDTISYHERKKSLEELDGGLDKRNIEPMLKLQCSFSNEDWKRALKEYQKPPRDDDSRLVNTTKKAQACVKNRDMNMHKSKQASKKKVHRTPTSAIQLCPVQDFEPIPQHDLDQFDDEIVEDGDHLLEQTLKGYDYTLTAKRRSALSGRTVFASRAVDPSR